MLGIAIAISMFGCSTASQHEDPLDKAGAYGWHVGETELLRVKNECWKYLQAHRNSEMVNKISSDNWSFWTVGEIDRNHAIHSYVVIFFPGGKHAWNGGTVIAVLYDLEKQKVIKMDQYGVS